MPKLKARSKPQEVKSGFESYDGPTPRQSGMYRAVLRVVKLKTFSSKNLGYYIVADFQAAPGDPKNHAQFDGYTMFIQNIIVQRDDGEPLAAGAQRNLDNFHYAIGVKETDPDIIFEDGDLKDGVNVKKIGKVNPVGKYVNIDCALGQEYKGERRLESNGIFAVKESAPAEPEEPAEEETEESWSVEGPEDNVYSGDDRDEREEELGALTIAKLKEIATGDYELDVKGLKKPDIIQAILDHEFETVLSGGDEDEDEEPEEEEEEEEEEDEEEEDEEEEEDDDARRAELEALTRAQLKAILKKLDSDFTVLKKHTDADLVDKILELEAESDEEPF